MTKPAHAPRRVGDGGPEMAPIGLGGMPMSLTGRPPEADAIATIHAALDGGMTLVDTADVYCQDDRDVGHNERLVAKGVASWSGDRTKILVATKGGLIRPGGSWRRNGRPEHLRAACDASLRALAPLGVERIALYQLHAPDPDVPFADSVGEMARLRETGKVERVGLSNVSVEQIDEASRIVPIASVQNRFSPFDRGDLENGVVRRCEAGGILYLAYSPVGGGHGQARVANSEALIAVGQRHGASPYQVALAWCLAQSPAILPIPGASKVTSARSSAAAMALRLTDEDLRDLARAFPVNARA